MRRRALVGLALASALVACTVFSPLEYLTNGDPVDASAPADGGDAAVTPDTIASAQARPGLLATDATALFWHNEGNGTIATVPTGGGEPRVVVSSGPSLVGLAVDPAPGGFVYWSTESGVFRAPKEGGDGGAAILYTSSATVTAFAIDDTSLYVAEGADGESTSGAVLRLDKAGGAAAVLDDQDDPGSLAVDATTLYWADGNEAAVRAIPKGAPSLDGGAPAARTTIGRLEADEITPEPATAFLVEGDFLYWADNATDRIARHARAPGSVGEVLYSSQLPVFGGIALDDTFVWFTNDADGSVGRAPKAGGVPETRVKGLTGVAGIVVAGSSVYFTVRGNGGTTGAVMRLPR